MRPPKHPRPDPCLPSVNCGLPYWQRWNQIPGLIMVFEIAGFLTGVAGIGLGLWIMHKRDKTAVFSGIYGQHGGKQRA